MKELLQKVNGFFRIKPHAPFFIKWANNCRGLALEETWRGDRYQYDLTFRALLILKYAGLL